MPTPNDGESQDDFIERCMGNSTMNEDFPDNGQRLAVCSQQWKDSRNKPRRLYVGADDAELRAVEEGEQGPVLRGYAAVFGKLSEDLGGFRERIAYGAFSSSLERGDDVRALVEHTPALILGRRSAGTLKLEENTKGLKVEIHPPDTQAGRDLLTSIRRGDINQMSFGFRAAEDSWEEVKGAMIRTLRSVELFDVSAVAYPAYVQTHLEARNEALASLNTWMRERNRADPEEAAAVVRRLRSLQLRVRLGNLLTSERSRA